MEAADYTILSPISLPKVKKSKNVSTFVIASVVAIGCFVETADASSFESRHNILLSSVSTSYKNVVENDIKLDFEESYSQKEEMLQRLTFLFESLNYHGWDGYSASPIERKSYLNARKIVMGTPDRIIKLWNVFPSPNGTISFEFKKKEIATMSVGNTDFSYIAIKSNKSLMNKSEFEASAAAEALISMSDLLRDSY